MPSNEEINSAITLAVGLVSALSSIWGYYFIVVVGIVAAIAALSANNRKIDNEIKILMTLFIALFGITNFYSLLSTTQQINSLIDYISTKDSNLTKVIYTFRLKDITLYAQPAGLIGLIAWLWTYDKISKSMFNT